MKQAKSSLQIGKAAFLSSAAIILALVVASGVLTLVLPAGEFQREVRDGRTLVVPGSYRVVEKPDYPAWRWLTAPVEVVFADGNVALITIVLFILTVGGSIGILEAAGVMEDMVRRLAARFGGGSGKRKYALIWLVCLFFMACAAFLGVYEGMVPMIVFIVPLAISLGWDSLTGLGMSLLPLAFGFSAAVTNPFTVGIAQRIADLPLFSGSLLRLAFFAVVYLMVCLFVVSHARRVEADPSRSPCHAEDKVLRARLREEASAAAALDERGARGRGRGLAWFAAWMAAAMAIVFATARTPGLSDLAFPVMGLFFLIGGVGGGLLAGRTLPEVVLSFLRGARDLLPGVVLILMAYSVKHVIVSGRIMDTILHGAAELISGAPPLAAAFLVYAATLAMNFFVGSASAKAFLMMPLLAPLADLVGITRQTAVLAFDFGDGFSNMFYPTNALLLIALSFTVVGYPKWIAWTAKLQLGALLATSAFLVLAVAIGYGPF